jgi:hypothetical protein
MKFTDYFEHTRKRPDRRDIEIEWILQVCTQPDYEEVQSDGRIRKWGFIKSEDKFLRVILLEDNETIHNAFFDRDFNKIVR